MKRLGASGKGEQFSSAKTGSQQKAPYPSAGDNPPGVPAPYHQSGTGLNGPTETLVRDHGKATRERIRDGGNGKTTINSTYGRGANDGSKPSPRKKIW